MEVEAKEEYIWSRGRGRRGTRGALPRTHVWEGIFGSRHTRIQAPDTEALRSVTSGINNRKEERRVLAAYYFSLLSLQRFASAFLVLGSGSDYRTRIVIQRSKQGASVSIFLLQRALGMVRARRPGLINVLGVTRNVHLHLSTEVDVSNGSGEAARLHKY